MCFSLLKKNFENVGEFAEIFEFQMLSESKLSDLIDTAKSKLSGVVDTTESVKMKFCT